MHQVLVLCLGLSSGSRKTRIETDDWDTDTKAGVGNV